MKIESKYSQIELEFRGFYQKPSDSTIRSPEIVAISEFGHRYTLCFWYKNSEGYYIQFVGSRPLESDIDWESFGRLCKYGQKLLDAKFELEESLK